ncbi:MAG TPA: hypothetical protein VN688_00930 [Gemmataceae bacterium]|nr:hypothetical protein [Gemmataceae bacterium]
MRKATSWRWGFVAWLAAMLIGSSLGCHPASTPGTTPTTTKPTNKQPADNKGAPVKPPPSDPG